MSDSDGEIPKKPLDDFWPHPSPEFLQNLDQFVKSATSKEPKVENMASTTAEIAAAVAAAIQAANRDHPVAATAVHVPPFNIKDPELWFMALKDTLELGKIVDKKTMSQHLFKRLDNDQQILVRDIIEKGHTVETFEKMETRLKEIYKISESQRVQQFMNMEVPGDMKPSELHTKLFQAGKVLKYTDDQIFAVWKEKVQLEVQKQLCCMPSSSSKEEIFQKCDEFWYKHCNSPVITSAATSTQKRSQNDSQNKGNFNRKFNKPNKPRQFQQNYQQRNRGPRTFNPNGGWCLNHFKYRDEARSCLKANCTYRRGPGNGPQ